ncbi:MAG: peptidoglycan DD-metalloendopeptidase family protein [Hyphomicrobiales bacterium]|jgi:murein DD-endopeptidase MepM/ murein hydrolase activator NlpD|nr:peptidoglycan DD-metalloendopeptidase family protein [Hyphomicrobiales bacterium]MCC7481212.1 peptidoglycan DD-metalloendopeptidase family protein [Hyphomicrobiales bacterium]
MAKRHQIKNEWLMKRRSPLRGFLQTRQIYVRSNGDVQFITVSPISQVCLLIIFLIGFLWMAFASVNIVFKDQLLELKQQKLFEARLDYENRLSELRASIERVNDRLLLDQQGYLKKVDEVKAEFSSLAAQQKTMENFFKEGWFPLKESAAPEKFQVDGALEGTFAQRYASDFRSRLEAVKPLDEMNASFNGLHEQQLALLKDAQAYSQRKLQTTSALLSRLGIRPPVTVNLVKGDAAAMGMGGPFLSVPKRTQREYEIAEGIETVHATLEQETKVRQAVADLPLVKPMTQITGISSSFGYRKDPLRLSLAFHGGIDFKGIYAAPVLATSNGQVTWAGPHGPYGNLVEIFHDNGVSTRYGHLKSVNVSLGQKISRGDLVGWMGSTGRSTGPHLHYETRVNGRVIDPQDFWRTQHDLQALETLN